jgi:hypothetical protein
MDSAMPERNIGVNELTRAPALLRPASPEKLPGCATNYNVNGNAEKRVADDTNKNLRWAGVASTAKRAW